MLATVEAAACINRCLLFCCCCGASSLRRSVSKIVAPSGLDTCTREMAPHVSVTVLVCLARVSLKRVLPVAPTPLRRAASLNGLAMEAVHVSEPAVETKVTEPLAHASLESDGESTPTSTRKSSPVPPQAPRARRGQCFAPVCVDSVEVYSVAGERMHFDTKDITTGDLRFAVAARRGVSPSQVRFFCDEQEVSDETPVLAEQLSVVLQHEPEPLAFPAML